MTTPVKAVGLLGGGALGGLLADRLAAGAVGGCRLAATITRDTSALPPGLDVLVEAAGVDAAMQWVPPALEAGLDVVMCSCAVVARPGFAERIRGKGRLLVPPGAIGGLDLFRAAVRGSDGAEVVLTTTKQAGALGAESAGLQFEGSAREAALAFPRTSNVAVALALATIGLDRTRVVVVADPGARRTRHVVEVRSQLGEYRLEAENVLAPGSGGRTSAVTAWSVVSVLEELAAGRCAGVAVIPP